MPNASLRAQAAEQVSIISHHQLILNGIQRQLDSIVYPILTLPPEITSEIFKHAAPTGREWEDDVDSERQAVDVDEAPLLLTHVCRAWRQIAISTPALWSTLVLDADEVPSHFSEIVDIWFSRAQHCPLSVKISGSLSEIYKFGRFMQTFRCHSGRIQSLDLTISVEDLERIDNRDRMTFPLLKSFSLHLLVDEELGLPPTNPITAFHSAPLLCEVLLAESPPSSITLPWTQLTKFTGQCFTVEECADALRLMPNLVDCHFAVFEKEFQSPVPAVVSHPNIESLTLFLSFSEYLERANSAAILASITLPGLQTLEILDPDKEFDPGVFDAFLLRSGSRLQKIVISGDALKMGVTCLLASRLPNLAVLEIHHPTLPFLTTFVKQFGTDTTLLPRLHTLSFLGCRFGDHRASVDDIVAMMAAPLAVRKNTRDGFASLQSFRVVSDTNFPASFLTESDDACLLPFKKLKEEGMNIYIGTETESSV